MLADANQGARAPRLALETTLEALVAENGGRRGRAPQAARAFVIQESMVSNESERSTDY